MAANPADLGEQEPGRIAGISEQESNTTLAQLKVFDPEGRIEILGAREGGFVECYVPIDLVDNEDVPVDQAHAQSLAAQFRMKAALQGGTGQEAAILMGLLEGVPKLKIMDGFHREAGLRANGEQQVFATVQLTDWDGLYHERIFNAKDNAHVRFSRVVQWIKEAWERTGPNEHLSVEQAALLLRYDADGKRLGLEPEIVEEAKAWMAAREIEWDIRVMTIRSHLSIAEHVDPKLVHATREKVDGHKLTAPTQVIIKAFADYLPDNFDLQNLVMQAAMDNNLQGPKVRAICRTVRHLTMEDAGEFITNVDWTRWEPSFSDTKTRALRRRHDVRTRGSAVLDPILNTVNNIRERVKLSEERGEPVDDEHKAKIKEADAAIRRLIGELGALAIDLRHLAGERSGTRADSVLAATESDKGKPTKGRSKPKNTEPPTAPEPAEDELDLGDIEDDPYLGGETEPTPDEDDEELDLDEHEEGEQTRPPDWDAEDDEDEDDEEEEDDPEPAKKPVSKQVKPQPRPPTGETPQEAAFTKKINDYLTGLANELPELNTRLQISRAEKIAMGPLLGDLGRVDDLREEISDARKRLRKE